MTVMFTSDKPLRSIRSFVCRAGRITPRQEGAIAQHWSSYGIEISEDTICYSKLFSNSSKTVLEIGFGMGKSLIELAQHHPHINYIGIEVHRPGVGALLAEIAKKELSNIRIFCGDAIEVLEKAIPDESLGAVLLFFPDPWPKKRHHKRRIVQTPFVDLIYQKLILGGYFHLATDVACYALHMNEVVGQHSGFNLATNDMTFPFMMRPKTKFEMRGQRLGHSIQDFIFVKRKLIL